MQFRDTAHFIGEQQLLEHQPAFDRPDLHDMRFALGGPLGDGAAPGPGHGFAQQAVRLAAALVRRDEIGLVVVQRIDALLRNERDDIDHVAGAFFQRLEFVGREGHEAALLEFIALHHVGPLDDLLRLLGDVLLLQARAFLAQQVEAHCRAGFGGRVELDGDRYQTEGKGQRGEGSGRHGGLRNAVRLESA
ncbi:hypothetical protein D3C72_1340280 [compost metagenome]